MIQNIPLTVSDMVKSVMDIAGVRVVCPFISDVYHIAEMLLKQSDIKEIKIKDYIKNPKSNGYRSLHLIVMVSVYFSEHKCEVPVAAADDCYGILGKSGTSAAL